MKLLVIQGSPDAQSFCHANAQAYYEKAQSLGQDVQLVDLATAQFDPSLRFGYRQHMADESFPQAVQTQIAAADHLSFFFPIWWSAEPAVLKGMLERVLTPGFAYHYRGLSSEKLLKGKIADLFVSCHAPGLVYRLYGGPISRWKHYVLNYCGIKLGQVKILGQMDSAKDTKQRRQEFMQQCQATLDRRN
ncbi:NAD(P)H-dependent oxidoreductase [Lactobacillus sp. DCY120]|uniref:NAD(P)H-dependent oxidoreductase n=1 Tax=Bombilactobacillus apium TaxID=2675299 RepID=A0A850R6C6_9LACO|nr:NAD(P)H-dependent oxidoreductase [Bombilactobacillus apium]NVY96095.1 NAD(P)H-dependent oxidoreductase [Bombilactobacillus apium]